MIFYRLDTWIRNEMVKKIIKLQISMQKCMYRAHNFTQAFRLILSVFFLLLVCVLIHFLEFSAVLFEEKSLDHKLFYLKHLVIHINYLFISSFFSWLDFFLFFPLLSFSLLSTSNCVYTVHCQSPIRNDASSISHVTIISLFLLSFDLVAKTLFFGNYFV